MRSVRDRYRRFSRSKARSPVVIWLSVAKGWCRNIERCLNVGIMEMLLRRTVIRRTFVCQSCSVTPAFTQLKRFAAAVVDFIVFRVCSQRMSCRDEGHLTRTRVFMGIEMNYPAASYRVSKNMYENFPEVVTPECPNRR